jgi:hypothetical protein
VYFSKVYRKEEASIWEGNEIIKRVVLGSAKIIFTRFLKK